MDTHGSAGDKANIDSLTGNKDAFIRNSTFAGYSTAFDLANIALIAYPFGPGGKVAEIAAGELLLVNEVKVTSKKLGDLSPGVLAEGDFGYLNQTTKNIILAETENTLITDLPSQLISPPKKIIDIANEAHGIYSLKLPLAIQETESLAVNIGAVSGRAKEPGSASNRLERAIQNGWVSEVSDAQTALDNLWDALGTRIVIEEPTEKNIDMLVERLKASISEGKIKVIEVNSLSGAEGIPYLTDKNLKSIKSISPEVRTNQKPYDSGYTAGMIYVEYPGGVKGEIQIVGAKVQEIANAEHIPYDAFLGKPYEGAFIKDKLSDVSAIMEPIRQAAQKLDAEEKAAYRAYLTESYNSVRMAEKNMKSKKVELPDGISDLLDINYLIKVDKMLNKYKIKHGE